MMGCKTTLWLQNENSLLLMKLGRKKLSGNYLTVPLEYHVTVRAHRTRCWNRYQAHGGVGVEMRKGSLCSGRGGGRVLPNGNPNKERQLLENGKLIPIMIPSKSLGTTESHRGCFCCLYCVPFLFCNSVSIRTQHFKNKYENKY